MGSGTLWKTVVSKHSLSLSSDSTCKEKDRHQQHPEVTNLTFQQGIMGNDANESRLSAPPAAGVNVTTLQRPAVVEERRYTSYTSQSKKTFQT